jgi:mannose-1-phosphate guanylyltransferase
MTPSGMTGENFGVRQAGPEWVAQHVDAVILVGGKGTRLRPLTLSAPKPMLPTAGVPFVAHLIARIKDAGVRHIVLGTSYKAEVFSSYFGDGSEFGVSIDYVFESEPLGTGGGIRNVADKLRPEADTILIFNGDVLSGCDLNALLDFHVAGAADATLHLTKVDDPRAFGCVPTDVDGRVTAFLEKDPNPVTDQINAGTYVFSRELLMSIPAGRPVSVERETFPGVLTNGQRMMGFVDRTYWRDLGTPRDFIAGSADLVRGIVTSSAMPGTTGEALVLAGAVVADSALLRGGTVVGEGCVVGANTVIDGAVLLAGVQVGDGAVIKSSVLGHGCQIGADTVLTGVVIGDGAQIGAQVELNDGARVWPGVTLADGSVRFSSDA